MTRHTYASALTPPPPTVSITSGGYLTTAISGTLYLQKRTRQGWTVYSSSVSFSAIAGQRVQVTIPGTARKSAEEIHEFFLSYSPTGNLIDACAIAVYPGFSGENTAPLPFTWILNRDEYFQIGVTVADRSQLPVNAINGMRRYVDGDRRILEYSAIASDWIAAIPQTFSTYVQSSQSENGCDRPINLISDASVVLPVRYSGGNISQPTTFWLVNDTGGDIAQGTRIRSTILAPNYGRSGIQENLSALLDKGQVTLTFQGYVDLTTGEIDTSGEGGTGTMAGIGNPVNFQVESVLSLPKPLPNNKAYCYQVRVNFELWSLGGRLPEGTSLSISSEFSPFVGEFSKLVILFENLIAPGEQRRRIFPLKGLKAEAESGSGIVGDYIFYKVGTSGVVGLQLNRPNQKIAINGNGFCSAITGALPQGTVQRAIISTEDGIGKLTDWHATTVSLDNTKSLRIVVNIPDRIREDYPDAIAGSSKGEFNATAVRGYLQLVSGGQLYSFDIVPTPGQSVEDVTISAAEEEEALPPTPAIDYGLYEIETFVPSIVSSPSSFATGIYRVRLACAYQGTIVSISHAPEKGCILEMDAAIGQLANVVRAWGTPIQKNLIRTIPQHEIAMWQTRRLWETGEFIVWKSASRKADNNKNCWKPNWLSSLNPGRWELELSPKKAAIIFGGG